MSQTLQQHNTLDMKYTVFGKMIDGDETLDAIEKVLINPKVKKLTDFRSRITIFRHFDRQLKSVSGALRSTPIQLPMRSLRFYCSA